MLNIAIKNLKNISNKKLFSWFKTQNLYSSKKCFQLLYFRSKINLVHVVPFSDRALQKLSDMRSGSIQNSSPLLKMNPKTSQQCCQCYEISLVGIRGSR